MAAALSRAPAGKDSSARLQAIGKIPETRHRYAKQARPLTAFLFMLGRGLIAGYLTQAAPTSIYGSMGTLALALLWIYYASLVVFIGTLLTAEVDERERQAKTA